jgi:hypothetical protein
MRGLHQLTRRSKGPRPSTEENQEIDEDRTRDVNIRHLDKAIRMAYKMMRDPRLDLKARQTWFKKYTEAVLAQNKLLNDRQERDWDKQLAQVREYRKKAAEQAVTEHVPDQNDQASQLGQA